MAINDFKILQPASTMIELLTFIEESLPHFSDSDEFIEILEKKKNENQHSLAFCVFMTNRCKSAFYFGRENSQFGSSVIDIAIYHGSRLIFTIEVKLLPTPSATGRNEHEYVYGKGAGIQRFKDGLHGLDNSNNFLSENGLMAFIKEGDYDAWLIKTNQWIKDAKWDISESIKKVSFTKIGMLVSNHKRNTADKVKLHHFWIKVA